eukprot:GHVH01005323.1.p1 GENE.GHVH01005323.1~~GHVH01005323.1.p1  ORF type:complete len:254 (+),score=20.25 GHVH01005323.1:35-763(+)
MRDDQVNIVKRKRREPERDIEDISHLTRFVNNIFGNYGLIFGMNLSFLCKLYIGIEVFWIAFVVEQLNYMMVNYPTLTGKSDGEVNLEIAEVLKLGVSYVRDFLFPFNGIAFTILNYHMCGFHWMRVIQFSHIFVVFGLLGAMWMHKIKYLRAAIRIYCLCITLASIVCFWSILIRYRSIFVVLAFTALRLAFDLHFLAFSWSLQRIIALGGDGSESKSYEEMTNENRALEAGQLGVPYSSV